MEKILYLLLLLGLKEAYLLARNLLGLIYHPFLTLRSLRAKKDFSQMVLLLATLSAPLSLAFLLTLFYYLSKYLLQLTLPALIVSFLKLIDLATFLFWLASFSYLAYWSWRVVKKNHSRFWEKI